MSNDQPEVPQTAGDRFLDASIELGKKYSILGKTLQDPKSTVAEVADAAAGCGLNLQLAMAPMASKPGE